MTEETRAAAPRTAPEPADARDLGLAQRVEVSKGRRARAQQRPSGSLWRQVARVGTLGWMTVLPITAGAIVGHMLDVYFGTGVRWALALILVGTAAGGLAVWRAIQEGAGE